MNRRIQNKLIRQVAIQPHSIPMNRAQSRAIRMMWKQFKTFQKLERERERKFNEQENI